jgi:uroporphyrinogen-III synthase
MNTPLRGRSVVVTRSADQVATLTERFGTLGAEVVEVPTIVIVEPADGGAALREAMADPARYDWLVVTSANGAGRVVNAARSGLPASVAVVGPGTAEVLATHGVAVDLVPKRFVGESLVESFPSGPGRVLLAQAEVARAVVAEGLRAKGWSVDVVTAYRTIPAVLESELLERAGAADAITFTSSSTVANYLNAAGHEHIPPIVVCIGPVTAATATERGIAVSAVATEHSLDGLVDATVKVLAR